VEIRRYHLTGGWIMKRTAELPVIGMDIAKNVFQIHTVDTESGELERAKLKRDKVLQFFVNRQPAFVVSAP
jgi:transposase